MTYPCVFIIHKVEVMHVLFCSQFLAETQKPSIHNLKFEEFTICSLDDFVGGDKDELLLCVIRTLRKY